MTPSSAKSAKSAPAPRKRAAVVEVTLQEGFLEAAGPSVALVGKDALEQARILLSQWRKAGKKDCRWAVRWANGHAKEGWLPIPSPSNPKAENPDLGAFLYDATCTSAEGGYPWQGKDDVILAKWALGALAFCAEEAGR